MSGRARNGGSWKGFCWSVLPPFGSSGLLWIYGVSSLSPLEVLERRFRGGKTGQLLV